MFQTFSRAVEFGSSATSSFIDCGASAGTVGTLACLVLAEPAAIIGGTVGAVFGASEDVTSALVSTVSSVGQTISRASEFGIIAASSAIDCGSSSGTVGTIAGLVLAEPAAIIGGAVGAAYGAGEEVASTVGAAYGASEEAASNVATTVGEAVSTTAEFGSNVASAMAEHCTAISTVWVIGFLILAVPISIIGDAAKTIYGVSKKATVEIFCSAVIRCAQGAFAYSTRLSHDDDDDSADDDNDENADLARAFQFAWKWAWHML